MLCRTVEHGRFVSFDAFVLESVMHVIEGNLVLPAPQEFGHVVGGVRSCGNLEDVSKLVACLYTE